MCKFCGYWRLLIYAAAADIYSHYDIKTGVIMFGLSTRSVWSSGIAGVLALTVATHTIFAQGTGTPAAAQQRVAQIVTSGTATIEIAPDRATISLAVETRAGTAVEAGSSNARIQTAVLDTLRKMGIPSERIRTQRVNVNPEYQHNREGGSPTVVGYQARNSIVVELHDLTTIGTVIDAGLTKGATSISGPNFSASNVDTARREALAQAVQSARADAEAMATAAGGRLGALVELSNSPNTSVPMYDSPIMMRAQAVSESTPIEVGVLRVTVAVFVRYAFVAN